MRRKLVVLGATGSIGRQTLDVAREFADEIEIHALASHRNASLLAEQARSSRPAEVVLVAGSPEGHDFGGARVKTGAEAMTDLCRDPDADLVVVATTGSAGLQPTLAALRVGKLVALANKETLVMAGPVIQAELRDHGGSLVPIDSEHSAIWQCLQGEVPESVERLTLTASGGALRSLSLAKLSSVTPEQALRHPTWSMGSKITIDSANLMNKGLEVIEARWLFDMDIERIGVVLHAQSVVHSLVTFRDGSVKAQLGLPDMRLPIQYALSSPHRWESSRTRLAIEEVGCLDFAPVDMARYPALRLALAVGRAGGTFPAALCAGDEVAVTAFLSGSIAFTDIPVIVQDVLDAHVNCSHPTLDDILQADQSARETAARRVSFRQYS